MTEQRFIEVLMEEGFTEDQALAVWAKRPMPAEEIDERTVRIVAQGMVLRGMLD